MITSASGGLLFYDLSNPGNPSRSFASDGQTHDVECVVYQGPDNTYYDKEICFAYNEDSVTTVDISSWPTKQRCKWNKI